MKPDMQTPSMEIGQVPAQTGAGAELTGTINGHEMLANKTIEHGSGAAENVAPSAGAVPIVSLPTPLVADASSTAVAQMSSSPLVAKDDDLIEKEWVEKAKKIVAETRDDPHKREEEATGLKVDYLKKRFGRDLGPAEKK